MIRCAPKDPGATIATETDPPFALLHADAHLLALNKPAGLLAVPGRGADKQDCLSARVQREVADALVVHRLDMATSGILLIGRGAVAQQRLGAAFAKRAVDKRYEAADQGQGLGWALMQALLARALPGLAQLDLTVTEGSPTAQGLYARCGFAVWGVLPRAIRVDGRDHAKVHMALALR